MQVIEGKFENKKEKTIKETLEQMLSVFEKDGLGDQPCNGAVIVVDQEDGDHYLGTLSVAECYFAAARLQQFLIKAIEG